MINTTKLIAALMPCKDFSDNMYLTHVFQKDLFLDLSLSDKVFMAADEYDAGSVTEYINNKLSSKKNTQAYINAAAAKKDEDKSIAKNIKHLKWKRLAALAGINANKHKIDHLNAELNNLVFDGRNSPVEKRKDILNEIAAAESSKHYLDNKIISINEQINYNLIKMAWLTEDYITCITEVLPGTVQILLDDNSDEQTDKSLTTLINSTMMTVKHMVFSEQAMDKLSPAYARFKQSFPEFTGNRTYGDYISEISKFINESHRAQKSHSL